MSRKALIAEALGLGPIWTLRTPLDQAMPDAHWWLECPTEPPVTLSQPAIEPPPASQNLPAASGYAVSSIASVEAPRPVADKQIAPIAEPTVQANPPAVHAASTLAPIAWDSLQRAVAQCQQCRLGATRVQAVLGRGNRQARCMIIGEAPGEQEDKQGQPFVGRAGKLLDNILAAAGLSCDEAVYIANVIKCRPPGNRNPATDEIASCRAYLHQQIQLVKPELIVALGRFAAQTLLNSQQSISRLRGELHDYQGTPLIVSFHPAYLLRNPPDKAKAWQDWVLAQQTLKQLDEASDREEKE